MRFPARWLPSAALGVCLFPLLVMAWVPEPAFETEVYSLDSEEHWISQSGVYTEGLAFPRFNTSGGRELKAISATVEQSNRFTHGIEVLDDEPVRYNLFGADPLTDCADFLCDSPMDCHGLPGGTWIKGRLIFTVSDTNLTVCAGTDNLPISVVFARGPYDGRTDHAGPSGFLRERLSRIAYSIHGRLSEPEILEEFSWDGDGTDFGERVHVLAHYGSVNRADCPPNGSRSFNVDSSYQHYFRVRVTLTYWFTE